MNSYILVDDGIVLSIGMKPYNIDRSHPNYDVILEAVKTEDWDVIPELANIGEALTKFAGNSGVTVDVEAGVVLYNGMELHNTLTERMIRMMGEGFSIVPLECFLENLLQNPSKRAVDELYTFLEYGKMPITEDGHFLAYKRVNEDYTSVHDSKTDNSIGKIVEMTRNAVDDRSDRTCSYGLHFCSHEYLGSFSGSKVVVLKINPRDVVSIPTDYNNTKGRACRYEVVGELSPEEVERALDNSIWTDSVVNDFEDADRDINVSDEEDFVYALEDVTQDYEHGYERGRKDGRAGVPRDGAVIVTEFVVDHSEFVAGYERGHADGRGHKARPLFNVISDNDDNEGILTIWS